MKKTEKKLLALLLALMMLVCAVPLTAVAEEEFELTYKNGYEYGQLKYKYVTGYKGTPVGEITIPDEVDGIPVVTIENSAFKGADKITKVNLTNNIVYIYDYAFENCTSLTEVTIPGSVRRIYPYAFGYCTSLKSVTIEEGCRSIEHNAFKNCTSLETVVLPESMTSVSGFSNCSALKSITIPPKVTVVTGFDGCTSLESVTLPENAETIYYDAFKDCTSLGHFVLPDTVMKINSGAFTNTAFYNDESNWTDGVLYIGKFLYEAKKDLSGECIVKDGTYMIVSNAFSQCENLKAITIPDSVYIIDALAFQSCKSLERFDILGDTHLRIGTRAFEDCVSLKELVFPGFSWLEYHVFSGCTSLESITILDQDSAYATEDGILFNRNKTIIEFYPPAKSGKTYIIPENVTRISGRAFEANHTIEKLVLHDNLYLEDYAFSEMKALKKVDFPTDMTRIPTCAFYGCEALERVFIPETITEIGAGAYNGCTSLRSVTLPEGLTKIEGSAFYYCPELKQIAIPESVETVENLSLGYLAFGYYVCEVVEDFTIYGYSGSDAERYAKENKFNFADISLYVPDTEPVPDPEPDVEPEPDPEPEETPKSFIEKIKAFFQKIADWFKNLFNIFNG